MKARITRTKIIATIGPASSSYEMLKKLAEAGVNTFRLNFSHGTHESHKQVINWIKKIREELKTHIGILADLQGPKIRIGEVSGKSVVLTDGKEIILSTVKSDSDSRRIFVNYKKFASDVSAGDSVLIDDGQLELKVLTSNNVDTVKCKIIHGGGLKSRKGVNLPNSETSLPSLTAKDLKDLNFILKEGVNWVALSFVRNSKDIIQLKKLIAKSGKNIKVIAKIEKPQAVNNIDDIIRVSDAVMIARGDLGVEMPQQDIPITQKLVIAKCIKEAKPVIIATQIMQSMVESPRPTRAEINDVANGIFDGADALMLSAETATGKFPVLVIETIKDIALNIEKQESIFNKKQVADMHSKTYLSDAICYNACKISGDVNAAGIISMTRSGYTGFMISSYRPKARILVFMEDKNLLDTLSIVWGIETFGYKKFASTDETIEDVKKIVKGFGRVKKGDIVINTAAMPVHWKGTTNMLKISLID